MSSMELHIAQSFTNGGAGIAADEEGLISVIVITRMLLYVNRD